MTTPGNGTDDDDDNNVTFFMLIKLKNFTLSKNSASVMLLNFFAFH